MHNRLAKCSSPYLRQHADNPIHWQPWDSEAFQTAASLSRPIFLSIGYSTCHWCHQMSRDTFSSLSVSSILNQNFISIKVDREERPDIDKHYMSYVQAISGGRGGWPLSVWMTFDGRPFYGCTYLGERDFVAACSGIAKKWAEDRQSVVDISAKGANLISALSNIAHSDSSHRHSRDADTLLCSQLSKKFDSEFGGFSGAPKFPNVPQLMFLLEYYRVHEQTKVLEMLLQTAVTMIRSGLHDHLEGGFHRYCVDAKWSVPHFEKMLYDQGQLLEFFAELSSICKDNSQLLAHGCDSIVQYVSTHLMAPDGSFYCAEDADSFPSPSSRTKEEGAFAVWTLEELTELIPAKDLELVKETFWIRDTGNAFENKNVLNRLHSPDVAQLEASYENYQQRLDSCMELMKKARSKRPRPHRDEKTVCAWNALMVSGLVKAGRLEMATKAFMQLSLTQPLLRTGSIPACADDYAFLIKAAIDLHQATLDDAFLGKAVALQAQMDQLFWDSSCYYYSQPDPQGIITRHPDDSDGAEPSANSTAAYNLLRLSRILDNNEYASKLDTMLQAFAQRLAELPAALPSMARCVALLNADEAILSVPKVDRAVTAFMSKHADKVIFLKKAPKLQLCKGKTCFAECSTLEEVDLLLEGKK